MRVRQCSRLLNFLFMVGVFVFGMMGGMYYEAMKHRVHQDGGGLRGAEPRNLPVGPDKAPISGKQLSTGGDSDGEIKAILDEARGEPQTQHLHQEPAAARGDAVVDAGAIFEEEAQPDAAMDQTDELSANIIRNAFGPPIHLGADVQSVGKSQVNVDDAKPAAKPADKVAHKQDQHQADQPQLPPQRQQGHGQVEQPQILNQPKTPVSNKHKQSPRQEVGEEEDKRNIGKEQPVHAPAPRPPAAMPAVRPGQPASEAKDHSKNSPPQHKAENVPQVQGKIIVSVVICGDRTDEALVMVKSAAILTSTPLHFHIFAEDELQNDIAAKLKSWPEPYRTKVSFDIHNIAFPPKENQQEWKKMFKKCATQRLFLPDLLQDTDALLYVDTDILFTKPLEYIWSFFKEFNTTQLAALTPEHEVTSIGWYNRFARHPYYGKTGLNSGVMLMNLTRMRNVGWSEKILPIYREYKLKITWGDQDLLNILFHFHPELVYMYQCEWNFRPDHCMYSLNCHRIEQEGVGVIHGNRGVYHNDKQLPFRVIYEAFRDYQFGTDLISGLVHPLKLRFNQPDVANMYCTKGLQFQLIKTLTKYCSRSS